MNARQYDFPAKLIACLMTLMMGALILTQHLVQQDIYFVNKFFLGMDYQDFTLAAR